MKLGGLPGPATQPVYHAQVQTPTQVVRCVKENKDMPCCFDRSWKQIASEPFCAVRSIVRFRVEWVGVNGFSVEQRWEAGWTERLDGPGAGRVQQVETTSSLKWSPWQLDNRAGKSCGLCLYGLLDCCHGNGEVPDQLGHADL